MAILDVLYEAIEDESIVEDDNDPLLVDNEEKDLMFVVFDQDEIDELSNLRLKVDYHEMIILIRKIVKVFN